MIKIDFLEEEKRTVKKTYNKFAVEHFKQSLVKTDWMSDERYEQYIRLHECLMNQENCEFIAESLVNDEDTDSFSKIAQLNLAFEILNFDEFVVLISGQTLTNRIITACERKCVYPELKYRIKQCVCIYMFLIGSIVQQKQ